MRNILTALSLVMMVTSCNVQKHVNRQQLQSSEKTVTKLNTQASQTLQSQTTINSLEKSITREVCDTTFHVPGTKITGGKSLEDLFISKSFELENGSVKGIITIDSTCGKISLTLEDKARDIPHSFSRTTESLLATNKAVNEQQDQKVTQNSNTTNENSAKSNSLVKDVKRTSPLVWLILIVLVATVLFYLVRYFYKAKMLK